MAESAVQIGTDFGFSTVARLVQKAGSFESKLSLVLGNKTANIKSMLGIMSLELKPGDNVKVIASGADETTALTSIETFLGGKNE